MNDFPILNSLRAQAGTVETVFNYTGGQITVAWNEAADEAAIAILDSIGEDPWTGGGFTEKHFRDALAGIPTTKKLNVLVNSRGGDVFEGFGIKNAIGAWPQKVTATITGVAASTASWMILDADEVRAPKASQMFIHEAMTFGGGNAEQMREVADRLDKTSEQIAGFYADKTGKPVNEMRDLMKRNTLMTGQEARDLGLIDVITDETPIYNFTVRELNRMSAMAAMRQFPAPHSGGTTNTTTNQQGHTMSDPITPAPKADTNDKVVALENRLRELEVRNVTAEFNSIAATRPTLNREEWLPKVIADPSLINTIRSFPETPAPAGRAASVSVIGNPLIEKYNNLEHGNARKNFIATNYHELARQLVAHKVMNDNTVDSGLANSILASDAVTVMRTAVAPLAAFTRSVALSPISPRQVINVPLVSTAGAIQTNPSNFETGDTTLGDVAVTVNQLSRSFHVAHAQGNLGLQLAQLAPTNAQVLSEGIVAVVTALLTNGNYGADNVIGAAASFDSADLPAILALAKNFSRATLLLDGGHLAYLLPTTRESFAFGEPGAYGFDGGIYKNNLWTSAATDIAGFVCGPDAICIATGQPANLPNGEYISQQVVPISNGLNVTVTTWFSRSTRALWGSMDVMFGAAKGDTTQGKILTTQ